MATIGKKKKIYKLLIITKMVIYSDGRQELYINHRIFVFFWSHFQQSECEAFSEAGSAYNKKDQLKVYKHCHVHRILHWAPLETEKIDLSFL